ncbi:glucosamine-6-phosphate deaminase NagB-II [Gayadomonas joobiniege]|uniref:glucosamine-6-phosphate deaminase NagB-II n=1 Tax=Gayadomonas joobiniege TaxID=1234606 RepID=UPI00037B338B|nr:SIS domain-containing protein [Gayadomonas joobiniege]
MRDSLFAQEAAEAPERIALQLDENEHTIEKLSSHLRIMRPRFVYMVGRGTSEHAYGYAKYLFETQLGVPVVQAAPSVTSIFGQKLHLEQSLVLVVSQSGRSPDVLEQAKMARQSGAYVVAMVNDEDSPLADLIDVILPLKAGQQNAIGASKTFLTSLSSLIQLAAAWANNKPLKQQIRQLPEYLSKAVAAENMCDPEDFKNIRNCAVLSRGFGYSACKEIALKLKGMCGIHAEAYSTAEFLHAAVALLEQELPLFNAIIEDQSYPLHMQQIQSMREQNINITDIYLPQQQVPGIMQPLTLLQRFYLELPEIAKVRGLNIDQPPRVQKIIETL